MKRTAFDERRDTQVADEYSRKHAQCTVCNAPTEVEELNTYGARCFACYGRYCHQGRYFPPLSKAERLEMAARVKAALAGGLRASPRDHMAYLSAKEEAGTASPAQRAFLAAARRPTTTTEDAE